VLILPQALWATAPLEIQVGAGAASWVAAAESEQVARRKWVVAACSVMAGDFQAVAAEWAMAIRRRLLVAPSLAVASHLRLVHSHSRWPA